MTAPLPSLLFIPPCRSQDCMTCDITPCTEATRTHEAVSLIQAGARATLVCQLTDLPKKRIKRMYTQLKGHPSRQGQMPFTDAWYVETDQRMLHATLVWQLYRRLARKERSEARIMLEVYAVYRCIVNKPELDLTRTVFVVRLVAMALWQERSCRYCHNTFLAPADEKPDIACPGCRLYHRYRCHRCGASLNAHPMGRPRTACQHCLDGGTSGDDRLHGRPS